MKDLIPRRHFILLGSLTAGAISLGGIRTLLAASYAERNARDFIRRYTDRAFVRRTHKGVTRLVAEVREPARLGEAFQCSKRHGIAQLHVAGTLTTFQIAGQTFEIENLLPRDFAAAKGATSQARL